MNHPCQYDLDRAATGERDDALAVHLETCERCRGYVDRIERERQSMLRRLPPSVITERVFSRIDRPEPSYTPLLKWAAACIVLLSFSFVVYILLKSTSNVEQQPEAGQSAMQWMGTDVGLRLFAKRGGRVIDIGLDEARPGDQLRYQIKVPDGQVGYAVVLVVENNNEVRALLPGKEHDIPYRFRTVAMLPGSVVVEDDNRPLELLVYVSKEDFDVGSLVESIRRDLKDNGRIGESNGRVFRQLIGH